MIARTQRAITLAWLFALVGWMAWALPRYPVAGAVGALAIAFGHSFFLACEFACMARVNRRDPAGAPTVPQLLRAWWAETRAAPQVFCWRQPFRTHAVPDFLPGAGSNGGLRGVVFIHGLVCNRGFWNTWMRVLRRQGRPFVAVSLEPVFGDIDGHVQTVEAAVRQVERATGMAPILVCHSMGGLVARAWLRQAEGSDGGAGRIHRAITIGTPHGGTWLAQHSRTPCGRQMQLGSAWLAQLAADEPPSGRARFICWYSNGDNIVFPASTGALEGADNRFVPAVPHVALATHPPVMQACLDEIARA